MFLTSILPLYLLYATQKFLVLKNTGHESSIRNPIITQLLSSQHILSPGQIRILPPFLYTENAARR